MTLIAAISDVHASYANLLGVMKMIEAQTPSGTLICNAGDTVAYGGYPEECVRYFRERSFIACVGGNYDEHVADYPERSDHYLAKWGKKRPAKYAAIRRDSGIITDASRTWLKALPHQRTLDVDGQGVMLSHYAPDSRDEGLLVITPARRLIEIGKQVKCEVIIAGHTHMAFVRSAGGTLFVNPGSVGRPWGAPSWALIELGNGKPARAEIKRWRE